MEHLKGRKLRIGTRGSPLALAMTAEVSGHLIAAYPELSEPGALEVAVIVTTGDREQTRPLSEIGGKGLFTKEIEEALLRQDIDLAVHSMKDMPTSLPAGLTIGAMLPREDPRDALFLAAGRTLADLPAGGVVGTSSLRRRAQILARRPDLSVVPLRGNVETRLRKLDDGVVQATVLALAGLRRLGLTHRITSLLSVEEMLPAVAQGAIGIEVREADRHLSSLLSCISHTATALAVTAERACLAVLDGSCQTPIAALAELQDGEERLRLRALLADPDGGKVLYEEIEGEAGNAADLGREAGQRLKAQAGFGFFSSGH